jgi:predicted esterase
VATAGKPLGDGRAVMILIHGRGADPESILTLLPALAHPDFTYLAPAAADGTWYPFGFMSPTARNEPGITSGIAVVHGLVDAAIAAGAPAERVILLGFSQGACLAVTAAQRRPRRYGGVVAYTGGLIGPPGTPWDESGDFDGTPTLVGGSDVDPHIPLQRLDETAAVLERMRAAVTKRVYPGMGHTVNQDEIDRTTEMMARIATKK